VREGVPPAIRPLKRKDKPCHGANGCRDLVVGRARADRFRVAPARRNRFKLPDPDRPDVFGRLAGEPVKGAARVRRKRAKLAELSMPK